MYTHIKGWGAAEAAAGLQQKAGSAGGLLYHHRDPISTSSVYKLKQKTVVKHRQPRVRVGVWPWALF